MKNNQVKLSREEFDAFECAYPSNVVIVEMPPEHDITTPMGINIGFNPDVQYSDMEGKDTSSHVADCADVYGTIVKQVSRLYFNPKDLSKSMSWDCDVETRIGDLCWTHPLAAKNCEEILVDDKVYKCLRYEDLFVVKRFGVFPSTVIKRSNGNGIKDPREIIVVPLNGNVLLETVYKPKLSEFDVSPPEIDPTRGIVKWTGTNNRQYQTKGIADFEGLKEGDLVVLERGCYPFYLERSRWNAHFDGDNLYFVVQARHVMAVL